MNIGLIPNYIIAQSHRGLRIKMLKTNTKNKQWHKYFDIKQFTDKQGKVKWIAWYYVDIRDEGLENE